MNGDDRRGGARGERVQTIGEVLRLRRMGAATPRGGGAVALRTELRMRRWGGGAGLLRRWRSPALAGAAVAALAAVGLLATCRGGDEIEVQRTVPYGRELRAAAVPGAGAIALAATTSAAPLAAAPAAESFGRDVLLYRIGESPCAVLRAGLDGIAAGPCGEPLQPRVYVRPDRALRLAELVARYAPFELEVGDEEVELHGGGVEVAGPVERRLVLEWARRLLAEANGVTATRAFRLAFEWHRQIQGGRDCDALAVYLSGEALATTCDGLRTTGDVAPERMAAILAWHDRLAPFQVVRQRGGGAQAVAERLVLPGAGSAVQDDATVRSIVALADTLHADLLARQLARQAEEEARIAAFEAARLAEQQAAEQAAAAARPWTPPPPPVDEQAGMTLSESIAVGTSREGEPAVVEPPAGEEGEEGGEDDGEEGAGRGTIDIRPSPPDDGPEDDDGGDDGGDDDRGGNDDGGGGDGDGAT